MSTIKFRKIKMIQDETLNIEDERCRDICQNFTERCRDVPDTSVEFGENFVKMSGYFSASQLVAFSQLLTECQAECKKAKGEA